MESDSNILKTLVLSTDGGATVSAPAFVLRVSAGPDVGKEAQVALDPVSVGTQASCALVLSDRGVSRFHFEVALENDSALLRDLGSTNGTFVAGVRVREAFVKPGQKIRAGASTIDVVSAAERSKVDVSPGEQFGGLVGASVAMRRLFAAIAKVAPHNVNVLIQGETGTGKDIIARELHARSARHDAPFVVVDCASIPADLAESELFGHVKGAFSGATADRRGAFEAASGGTIFLDEIGELELNLQSRLLRAIEAQEVKRVGADAFRRVDVRVLAATHRDLRVAVNKGVFREDLYYRLAVATVHVPPLRERPEDIAALAKHFCQEAAKSLGLSATPPLPAETLERLRGHAWRGNARELRNFVERFLVFAGEDGDAGADAAALVAPLGTGGLAVGGEGAALGAQGFRVPFDLPFKEARDQWLEAFEKAFIVERLRRADGNVTRAAREIGIDRAYLLRIVRRHALRGA